MLIKHDEAPIIHLHDLETSPCDLPCEQAIDRQQRRKLLVLLRHMAKYMETQELARCLLTLCCIECQV